MNDERLRLFVALELPGEAREALARWGSEALREAARVRRVATDQLHATLCFLGWRSQRDVEAIATACGVLAGRALPELSLGEAIWLPRRRPRVLAVALVDSGGALADAQAALAAELAAGGWYDAGERPFLAHVTVARAGRGVRAPRAPLPAPPQLRYRAPGVTLYRSRLERSGARYEALASVELGEAP